MDRKGFLAVQPMNSMLDTKSLLRRAGLLVIMILGLVAGPRVGLAYSFVPTQAEFLTWPDYCKVVYLRTNIGKGSTGFAELITPEAFAAGTAALGSEPFGDGGVHHYCASVLLLARARNETDKQQRDFLLSEAKSEAQFTMARAIRNGDMYVQTSTQVALVQYEQGDVVESLNLLEELISGTEHNAHPYLAKSIIHFRRKEYGLAYDTLKLADSAVEGSSSEVHYYLGLILVKMDRPEEAVQYAKLAYGKGYPLPGLMFQLERRGYW